LLAARILSSLVLAPVALAAVWLGSWAFAGLAAVAGVLMSWEWTRLCLGRFGAGGGVLAVMAAAVAGTAGAEPVWALALIVVAGIVAPAVQSVAGRSPWWMVAGAFYIGVPTLSLVWIRSLGLETLLWLLLVVWATDIGAYAAGRAIGGPKLMPRVSPKKTWAGLLGGLSAAALVGAVAARWSGFGVPGLAMVSAALAIVAQAGDLAESGVKRYFGVKDSSGIIPGHGGVLDRVDGLLAVAPVVALLCLAFHGGLPEWR
jgi:phosphatidate cytidylyltransferase